MHEGVRPNVRRDLAQDVFALEKYRPAYQEGKATLLHLYGAELWQEIDARIGNWLAKEDGKR
jgi:hypothetical protein